MNSLIRHGFQILPGVFAEEEIHVLRHEADRVASDAGSACVRHLGDRSGIFRDLARSPESIAAFTAGSTHTCECRPGDVLLMSPLILHSSPRSASPSRRRVLHFEFAPTDALDSRLTWHETLV